MGNFKKGFQSVSVAMAYLVALCLLVPLLSAFEFDFDEGINLAKADLVGHGHSLYSEIWSDQPPAFTYFLAALFRSGFRSVEAARLAVALLSATAMGCFFALLRRRHGSQAALFATALLAFSPGILRLSGSVMIGWVSLCLLLIALYAYLESEGKAGLNAELRVVASGAFAALALAVKLFVFPFLMLACVWIWRARRMKLWLAGFGLVGSLFLISMAPEATHQLLGPHWVSFLDSGFTVSRVNLLLGLMPILAGSLGGILIQLRSRQQDGPAFACLFISLAILMVHSPLYYHHLPLVSVPAAWISASIFSIRNNFGSRPIRLGTPLSACIWTLVVGSALMESRELQKLRHDPSFAALPAEETLSRLRSSAGAERWLMTDRPMFAFRAGRELPPQAAVLSRKRLRYLGKGGLDRELLQAFTEKYRFRELLLARYLPLDESLRVWLTERGFIELNRGSQGNASFGHFRIQESR